MKRKLQHINKKKWVMTILSLLVILLLTMSIGHKQDAEVDRVNIKIKKIKGQKNLINKKDVVLLFRGYLSYDLSMATIEELDLQMLEKILVEDVRVKKAQVFIDAHKVVNVYIIQREPIVRINDGEAYSYYLDKDQTVIPVQKKNALRVPIATGNLEDIKTGLAAKGKTNLKQVLSLARAFHEDEFMQALVEQIHVKEDNSVVVIPKLGREKIIMGDVKDLAQNIKKLKLFYRKGLPESGWNHFAELNMSYKGQVLTVKR